MKKWILYIFLVIHAPQMLALNISYRVYDYSIHHTNGRIYLGGKFIQYKGASRNNLACIDLNNNLLPWAPTVFHNTNSNLSRVNSIVADTGAVFIGGPFSHVNGNPRARLAKLDLLTGNTIAWNPNLSNGSNSIIDVNEMVVFRNQLIISDKNQSVHIVNKNTGVQMKYTSLPLSLNQMYNSKLALQGNMLFVASSFNMEIYAYELIPSGDSLLVYQRYVINTSVAYAAAHEYVNISIEKINASTGRLYVQLAPQNGNFPIDDEFKSNKILRYSTPLVSPWITSNNPGTWQGNLLDPSLCGSGVPCYCNPLPVQNQVYSNPGNQPFFSGSVFYDGRLLTTGYRIGKNSTSCAFPPNHLSNWFNSPTSTFTVYDSLYRDTIFNAPEGFARNLIVFNGRVYYITARQDIIGDNLYDEIGAMCVRPLKPDAFTLQTNPVCRGKSYAYAVPPNSLASSFIWSYTGAGVTINNNGNDTISVLYGINATPGVLSVKTVSECGFISNDSLKITISFHAKPNVSAGSDKFLTCTTTQVQLNGSSSTAGVTYMWHFSTGDSTTVQNPMRNTSGTEIVRVTEPINFCINYDTMQVMYDTIPPTILTYSGATELTCAQNNLLLDAASMYPVDSLYWTGTSYSSPNPATVNNAGSYLLSITSNTNGCTSLDTISVTTNYVFPQISPPAFTDTLTCIVDSVLLGGSSSTTNTILFWENPNGDTLYAPAYGIQGGGYTVTAMDNTNGCSASAAFVVQTYYTSPHVGLPVNTQLNCSYPSVQLTGSSLTPGATLFWNGSSISNAPNSVTVSDTGQYILSVVHPQNGCIASDTFSLVKTNELILEFVGDSTICNGGTVTIFAQPIGGTPSFNYNWLGGFGTNSSLTISPTDTTDYIVIVTDGNGCSGTDTVRVNVPDPMSDSTVTFQPCDPSSPSGQIQVDITGGIPPYVYSIDSANTWQASPVFTGLPYGIYQIYVEDAIGCQFVHNATISQASATATANFLVNTSSYLTDTFVVVDISTPRPDSVQWDFPATCTIVNTDEFSPQVVYSDTGALVITMHAFFGTCELIKTKTIHVYPVDTTLANDHNQNGIKRLVVYPNPNNGNFTYEVEFFKKQDYAILIFDNSAIELYRYTALQNDYTIQQVTLSPGVTGSFILKVIGEYDADHEIIIVNE